MSRTLNNVDTECMTQTHREQLTDSKQADNRQQIDAVKIHLMGDVSMERQADILMNKKKQILINGQTDGYIHLKTDRQIY